MDIIVTFFLLPKFKFAEQGAKKSSESLALVP